MNKKTLLTLFLTLSLSCGLVTTHLLSHQVYAQANPGAAATAAPIDISVSPPTTYLTIKPGEKITHTVTLEQNGSAPLSISPSIVDFDADGHTGQPVLGTATSFRHITLSIPGVAGGTSFTLQPGQKKNLSFTITIPSDAAEREYPLTLLFKAQPDASFRIDTTDGESSSEKTIVSGVVGSNLIILVSATDRDRGHLQIESISTQNWMDSFGELEFQLQAANQGLNATTASGSAVVKNWQGKTVAEFAVYPDMVLANKSRNLRTAPDFSPASNPTTFDPTTLSDTFRYSAPFLLGPYTITAELARSGQDSATNSTATVTVIALPYTLVILLIVGLLMYLGYRAFVRKSANMPLQGKEFGA